MWSPTSIRTRPAGASTWRRTSAGRRIGSPTAPFLTSGPFACEARTALLLISSTDREALDALVATDPFWTEGLVENLVVREWNPIFGAFNGRSSMAGRLQTR